MLVVIDMQVGFSAANCPTTIANVCKEIEKAMENDEWVLIVEYGDTPMFTNGRTVQEILDTVADYDYYDVVEKHYDGGGDVIQEWMSNNNVDTDEMRICGVNFGACVLETVRELAIDRVANLKVLEHACNQPSNGSRSWFGEWDWYDDRRSIEDYAEIVDDETGMYGNELPE